MTSIALPSSLGVLAVVLAATIALELKNARHGEPMQLAPAAKSSTAVQSAPPAETDSWPAWVVVSIGRPLFEPTRRPPAQVIGPGASHDLPRLAGIIITATSRSAIFAGLAGGGSMLVVPGTRMNGFVVRSIEADGVTIVTSDGPRVLRPSFDSAKASSQVAAPPSPSIITVSPALTSAGAPPPQQPQTFSAIRGLSGRPLGLTDNPDDATPPTGSAPDHLPGLPVQAQPGSSP